MTILHYDQVAMLATVSMSHDEREAIAANIAAAQSAVNGISDSVYRTLDAAMAAVKSLQRRRIDNGYYGDVPVKMTGNLMVLAAAAPAALPTVGWIDLIQVCGAKPSAKPKTGFNIGDACWFTDNGDAQPHQGVILDISKGAQGGPDVAEIDDLTGGGHVHKFVSNLRKTPFSEG